mmetsp:Transcript_113692/g.212994  ORF Transcript_113692/g.212994 Transcript_113692/m.212994 type:complete len:286 (+) Transcript_113692:64-921(+)
MELALKSYILLCTMLPSVGMQNRHLHQDGEHASVADTGNHSSPGNCCRYFPWKKCCDGASDDKDSKKPRQTITMESTEWIPSSHNSRDDSIVFAEFPDFVASPEEYCFDPSVSVNEGGSSKQPQFWYTESYIPVRHFWGPQIPREEYTELEEDNFWMTLATKRPEADTLMYRPGRTIAFPDLNQALKYVNYNKFQLPKGTANFTKAHAMRLLRERLHRQFASMVFYQHLDDNNACDGRCCSHEGSRYGREIVALRGWNRYECPGHENLTFFSHPCDCKDPKISWC